MIAPYLRSKQFLRALLQFAALTMVAGTTRAQDAPGSPPPPASPPPEQDSGSRSASGELPGPAARTNALIGGSAMLVGWYGAGVGTSLLWSDAPGAEELYIPVAGPWMALAETGCPESEPDCSIVEVIIRATLTTLSGVGQIGGIGIIGEGLFVPTRSERAATKAPELRAQVQPLVGRDGLGLGVVGIF